MSEEILKLIENVNPDNIEKLEEIDARVWCLLKVYDFERIEYYLNGKHKKRCFSYYNDGVYSKSYARTEYTRSRDALKAIRPKGWVLDLVGGWKDDAAPYYRAILFRDNKTNISSPLAIMLSEEFAELHAIVQAIQWERDNARKGI